MSCLLRLSGDAFRVDAYLAAAGWQDHLAPCGAVWRRGELRRNWKTRQEEPRQESGMQLFTGSAGLGAVTQQKDEALLFLQRHKNALLQRLDFGCTVSTLDFGIHTRMFRVGAQFDAFSAALIEALGELRIGLELSQYPPPSDRTKKPRLIERLFGYREWSPKKER